MTQDTISRFWDNFIEKTKTYGLKPATLRWHVKHAEAYIRAHSDRRLAEHTVQDVTAYLQEKGRNRQLTDWQFAQVVRALQILFVELVKAPWAATFPWQDWIDNARGLAPTHATVARDYDHAPDAPNSSDTSVNNRQPMDGLMKRFKQQFPNHADRIVAEIRVRQYSIRTEQSYLGWLGRFVQFHGMRDPAEMDGAAMTAFLEHLVVNRRVSASTQNQALNALIFFYKHVLKNEAVELGVFAQSKKPRRLPVVLTRDEVQRLFAALDSPMARLMAGLLYGCGLRLMECVRLRILDVDFGYQRILIRNAKGGKDRIVPLPNRLNEMLHAQIKSVEQQHRQDLACGLGGVYLPDALSRKYPRPRRN